MTPFMSRFPSRVWIAVPIFLFITLPSAALFAASVMFLHFGRTNSGPNSGRFVSALIASSVTFGCSALLTLPFYFFPQIYLSYWTALGELITGLSTISAGATLGIWYLRYHTCEGLYSTIGKELVDPRNYCRLWYILVGGAGFVGVAWIGGAIRHGYWKHRLNNVNRHGFGDRVGA